MLSQFVLSRDSITPLAFGSWLWALSSLALHKCDQRGWVGKPKQAGQWRGGKGEERGRGKWYDTCGLFDTQAKGCRIAWQM